METVTCLRCGDFLNKELKTGQDVFCDPCFALGSACRAGLITVAGASMCALLGLLPLASFSPFPWFLALRVLVVAFILGVAAFQSAFSRCHPASLQKTRFFSRDAAFILLFTFDFTWRFLDFLLFGDYVSLFLDSVFGAFSLIFDSFIFALVIQIPYMVFHALANSHFKSRHSSCWTFAEAVRERKAELATEPLES